MDISERLSKLLIYNKISAIDLSRIINMQRSTLSHILSGRNKPSLELIERLHKAFPELSLEWLISGTGEMLRSFNKKEELEQVKAETPAEVQQRNKPIEPSVVPVNPEDVTLEKVAALPLSLAGNKNISKIILVYNDNTFEILNNLQM